MASIKFCLNWILINLKKNKKGKKIEEKEDTSVYFSLIIQAIFVCIYKYL